MSEGIAPDALVHLQKDLARFIILLS